MSLARRNGQPTLLVDADLRVPDLHDLFDVALQPGLVDILDEGLAAEHAIVRDVTPGIDLLPAGMLKKSSHATLRLEELQAFLARVRTKYRYIVVDAPPVLAASEALVIAASADGTLVCAMRDVSRVSQLQLTCQKLAGAGARLLGTVMSGVPTRIWAQKYGGYGYGGNRYVSRRSLGHDSDELPNPAPTELASGNDDS
jgi:tyrosine-protein kinase Etk/Wzc